MWKCYNTSVVVTNQDLVKVVEVSFGVQVPRGERKVGTRWRLVYPDKRKNFKNRKKTEGKDKRN